MLIGIAITLPLALVGSFIKLLVSTIVVHQCLRKKCAVSFLTDFETQKVRHDLEAPPRFNAVLEIVEQKPTYKTQSGEKLTVDVQVID